MEDEVIAYLARKVYELEIQLKIAQQNSKYYSNLVEKYKLDCCSEEAACQTTDSN